MSNKRGQSVWNASKILSVILGAALAAALPVSASAQSLNPKAPTPMVAGENRGTVDCMVGPQFWSFKHKKGKGRIVVSFTSMGLFGNPQTTTIEIVLHRSTGKVQSGTLTSKGTIAQVDWPADFPYAGTDTIEIRTTGRCLVRAGGDYSITISGNAIDFGGAPAASRADPIVGNYAVMICPPDFDCQSNLTIRFSANGTVQTTDGHRGTWKVFDPNAMIYSVAVGRNRWSLKLVPGTGLCNPGDLSIVFQAVR
jgi:hypothetical protein